MIKLNINLDKNSYPIYITTEYGSFEKCLASSGITGKVALITDSNVEKYQLGDFEDALKTCDLKLEKYVIPAGEQSKNLETVKNIYKFLMDLKLDRDSALIALGGGVTGDIAGFAAATYLRGIKLIQVPTTMLAQADSSVGGKVGVDFQGAKNMIGAFYQPSFVYINVNSLRTLPKREIKSGLAEVIKHGIIMDRDFFDYIDYNIKRILDLDLEVLQYIVRVNCYIKGRVVEEDEKEKGTRAILNFGHTIGHAIESVSCFRLLHGECVSIGMAAAFRMAMKMDMVSEDTVNTVESTLVKAGLPVRFTGLNIEDIYRQLFLDKKIRNGKLMFILPKRIGEVIRINIDDERLIMEVLDEISKN